MRHSLSPPTPSPVNWSLLHLNKLGIMKRCFHSAIIINHDSGLPCIQGPAWLHRCSAKTRMMRSWGQTHQWQCLPSHNLIFLIDRKTGKYKLAHCAFKTTYPNFKSKVRAIKEDDVTRKSIFVVFPQGFPPCRGFLVRPSFDFSATEKSKHFGTRR